MYYRTIAGSPEPRVAVNFRMSSDELITKIPVRYFNGKELL
ncbi:hypothetical protein [Zooshikella sp. RANM57]